MRYLLVLLGLLVSGTAEAVDCHEPPTCESLGYSKTKDKNCIENGYLNCPFDSSYTICVQHNCATLGFTKTDKTSWCDEIVTCKDDEKYTLCAKLPSCKIGDVYYADGSCGDVSKYTKDSTPVGVVYWVSEDGHGKVINLHDLGKGSDDRFDPQNPYGTSSSNFEWGGWGTDIDDLKNWDCNNGGYESTAKTGDHSHEFWSGGKKYTDLIAKAVGETNLQYAAPAVKAFYPDKDLENDSRVGKGKWYLPTLGELMDLYGSYYLNVSGCDSSNIGSNGTIKAKVNETLAALKNKSVPAEKLTDNYYWSSSEVDNNSSWKLKLDSGTRYWDGKGHGANVRASLEF